MNPESKVYLIIGLLIISSSLVTAGFSYVAFRAALRRSLNGMFRSANHGMPPGYRDGRPSSDVHTTDWARKPVGTGAYRIALFEADRQLLLEAFDDYWGGRPPRMPESSGLIPCQSLVDFTIAASTDESR